MMLNDDLKQWSDKLDEVRRSKLEAMENAMRRRGWKRSVEMFFARTFAKIEALGKRWRDEQMRGGDE